MWLLTTPPHLECVAALPCDFTSLRFTLFNQQFKIHMLCIPYANLSLIACFLTLMFHKVVWQNMQEVVGLLITTLQQIYHGIFQWKNFVNWLWFEEFDWIMAMSSWPHFFGPPCIWSYLGWTQPIIEILETASRRTLESWNKQFGILHVLIWYLMVLELCSGHRVCAFHTGLWPLLSKP